MALLGHLTRTAKKPPLHLCVQGTTAVAGGGQLRWVAVEHEVVDAEDDKGSQVRQGPKLVYMAPT